MQILGIGSQDPYGHLFSQNRRLDFRSPKLAWRIVLRLNYSSAVATFNRLQTFANSLSNASTADPPFPRNRTDPLFTFAGLRTPAYNRPSLETVGLLIILFVLNNFMKSNS